MKKLFARFVVMSTRAGALFVAMSLLLIVFVGTASAHVVVYPNQVTQGSYEKFIVRVPTEKEIATIKVEVMIPADVTISRFMPISGWDYDISRDDSGKIISVAWSATGDGLSATEFGEFSMQGKVGDGATELVWRAIQTYADDSIVEWVGPAASDFPAPVTTAVAKADAAAGVGEAADADSGAGAAGSGAGAGTDSDQGSQLPLYLSIVAVVLSLVALLLAVSRRAKK